MARKPELNISLREFDKLFLKASALFSVTPLKVSMYFDELDAGELRNLEEYANVEDGRIERWLLVPDSISIGALDYTVKKAFGLPTIPYASSITLEDQRFDELFPNMEEFFINCGSIMENPLDMPYSFVLYEAAHGNNVGIPHPAVSVMAQASYSYEEAQSVMKEQFETLIRDGVDVDGQKIPFSECVTDLSLIDGKSKDKDFPLTDNLSPDLQLRDVLAVEGRKVYELSQRPLGKRKIGTYWTPKPFTDKLVMYLYDDEEYPAYTFEITRPKDVYSLIREGWLSAEEYAESVSYVLGTMMPDCIAKKGYDLFGPDQIFYHDFIMAIHGPESEKYLSDAVKAGWREPYVDLKKIFRIK